MRSNLQIVADHYAASDRKDLDGMLADLAPDAAWTEMAGFPYAGTYVGKQGVIEGVFRRIGADWEGFTFTLERLFDAGDAIIATGRYSGKYRATGKSFACRVTHIWQLADGKVQRFEQFADTLLVANAMS
jgi:ketosteroid isomerase-like protein